MIEMGKKYRTRDGREVRIYAVDSGGDNPVHGAIWDDARRVWDGEDWTDTGLWVADARSPEDLIEVLPEVTVRQYLRKNKHLVGMADHENNPVWGTIGAIDITHNGKEIIDVKVVK